MRNRRLGGHALVAVLAAALPAAVPGVQGEIDDVSASSRHPATKLRSKRSSRPSKAEIAKENGMKECAT